MSTSAFAAAFAAVALLVKKFDDGRAHYMSAAYQEAEARQDFIDKFWTALGWDVTHEHQHNPYQQEVQIEHSQKQQGESSKKRADYAFFLGPDYKQVLFFVEAKKPIVELHQAAHYFQTARYGWNAKCALSVLHDFEQMQIIDCRPKPDMARVLQQTYRQYRYHDYLSEEKFSEIYWLFSREAVAAGNLKKAIAALPKAGRGARLSSPGGGGRVGAGGAYKPIDEDFLNYIDGIRDGLAHAFKKGAPHLDGESLTEATQRTVDRLVFIRFLEDKQIEPDQIMARWTSWKDFVQDSRRLDAKYNGVVFKPNALIDDPAALAGEAEKDFLLLCEDLSGLNNPYHFNYIPIHILGSIYERFLGKVVVSLPPSEGRQEGSVTIEEKPEVRKAGGVYYTPKYIVDYIVRQTVGKLIEGKTPKGIAEMRFADIACGSGSFLIGVYECLLDYHRRYYQKKYEARTEPIDKRNEDHGLTELRDGVWTLSLRTKQDILLNNIYGVDLDAQAVEVTQLSLFLKMLEDESLSSMASRQLTLTSKVLPDLSKNIQSGNSLIDWDIQEGRLFEDGEAKLRKLHPFDYESAFPKVFRGKAKGFDAVVGNPPWGAEFTQVAVDYLKERNPSLQTKVKDSYSYFVLKALSKIKTGGLVGYLLPNTWLLISTAAEFRKRLLKLNIHTIQDHGDGVFVDATVESSILITERVEGNNEVSVARFKKGDCVFESQVNKALWLEDELARIVLETNSAFLSIRKKASEGSLPFAQTSEIIWGIKPYQVGYGEPPQTKEILESRAFHSDVQHSPEWKPLLVGSNVDRYAMNFKKPIQYIRYGKWLMYPSNEQKMLGAKILLRQTSDKIRVTIDEKGFYCQNSLFIITSTQNLNYLVALLNSSLFDFFYKLANPQSGKVFAEVKPAVIKALPIKTITPENQPIQSRLSLLVTQLLEAKQKALLAVSDRDKTFAEGRAAALDRQIDALVYSLYGLTEEEIALVEGA